MKKSELQQIIKEELLKEYTNVKNDDVLYAIDYYGPEDVNEEINVEVVVGTLFPYGIKIKEKLGKKLQSLYTDSMQDYKIGEKEFLTVNRNIQKDIKSELKPLAKKFEADIEKLLQKVVKKYNK